MGEVCASCCHESLPSVHGLGYLGDRVEVVVEGYGFAVEVEHGAAGGVEDVVAGGEVPDGEAFGELDDGFGHAGGDVAEADGAEVHADPSSGRLRRAGGGGRCRRPPR